MAISAAAAKRDYALEKKDLDALPKPLTAEAVKAAAVAKYGSEQAFLEVVQVCISSLSWWSGAGWVGEYATSIAAREK